jgi:thioredoxin reductase (NADPH)
LTDKEIHEVIIIGAGPAALSAAIYTTREDIETLILEKGLVGGLAAITETIENYPGFPKGVGGLELAKNLQAQAERFGAKIELGEVTSLRIDDDQKIVTTYMGEKKAKVVLVATGNDYRHIGVKGEEEYMNRGVHYCATCDGPLYKGKKMVVVGGGNSAAQESLFLAKLAESVDILIRKDKWKASEILIKEVENNPKITVHFNTEIQSIEGEQLVNKIKVVNNKTNKESQIKTEAVFVFVGLIPNTQFLASSGVELDERGFVKTNDKLETNIKGIFCAGDVRSGATEQIASAVGEGANAALAIREYLDGQGLERSYSTG